MFYAPCFYTLIYYAKTATNMVAKKYSNFCSTTTIYYNALLKISKISTNSAFGGLINLKHKSIHHTRQACPVYNNHSFVHLHLFTCHK